MKTTDVARPVVDAEARERVVRELDRSFCVEAAAGTGKTTLLVQRILRLLEQGLRPSQLAAITFTELAAAELKGRIRERLAAGEHPAHRRALEEIEAAQISTIHAMALAILKERPIEAGLDPGFETVDGAGSDDLFDRLWRRWLAAQAGDGVVDGPGAGALRLALKSGLRVSHLRTAARGLYEQRDVALEDRDAPTRADQADARVRELAAQAERRIADLVEALRAIVRDACLDGGDSLAQAIDQARAALSAHPLPAGPEVGPAEILAWWRRASGQAPALRRGSFAKVGAAPRWRGKAELAEARALMGELAQTAQELADAAGQAVAQRLAAWLREFVAWAQEEKRRLGLADFLDQLLWCRDLLRDHLEVRRHFQRRFQALLVDEFQDTDPLQAEIVFFLAEREPTARDWRDVTLGDGRLFVVGDPKQSIYRFRRADVEMYREAATRIERQGRRESIHQNFRTLSPITRAVNALFERWMTGPYQPSYVGLEAYRPDPEPPADPDLLAPGAYRLEVPGMPEQADAEAPAARVNADQLREMEARTVAQALANLVGGGRLMVEERGTWRRATWRDAVVLMPAFTGIETYEQALQEAGVPYRVVGGRLFYHRPEVREIIVLLGAVRNPSDERAVLGALRSGFFGISDAELWHYRRHGGRLDAAEQPPDEAARAAPAVVEAMARIREWHEVCRAMRPVQALRRILADSGYLAYLQLERTGSRAAANVEKLLAQAAAWEQEGAPSFGAFVDWLSRRGPGGSAPAEEEDSPLADDEEDAVRIMTVHKAKGLEFPVVVVANMGRPLQDLGPALVDRERGRVELRIGAGDVRVQTPGFDEAAQREQMRLEAERVRLYYVALTRARDYLLVSGARHAGGFWDALEKAAGAGAGDVLTPLRLDASPGEAVAEAAASGEEGVTAPPGDGPAPQGETPTAEEEARRWQEQRQALLDAASRGLVVVPARQAGTPAGSEHAPDRKVEAGPLPIAEAEGDVETGHDGTRLGQAFHVVMEQLARRDFALDQPARTRLVQAVAGAMRLSEAEREAVAVWVRLACEGQLAARARRARRRLAEVPIVYARAPGELVQGRMDLLLEEPEGELVVVDYKTDPGPPQRLAETYAGQAASYAEAVARAAPGARVRVLLYAARTGELVEAAIREPVGQAPGEGGSRGPIE
ncbi:MAG TPA: UvrD-helicase domain-containing protein [Limnochordales bacterium]